MVNSSAQAHYNSISSSVLKDILEQFQKGPAPPVTAQGKTLSLCTRGNAITRVTVASAAANNGSETRFSRQIMLTVGQMRMSNCGLKKQTNKQKKPLIN